MARARNIKPSLFKNEVLGEADPLLTILFEGLWCLADREGRLEDRPKRIKAEIFPYRDLPDFNGYLTELEQLGFICRYSVDSVDVIQVLNFKKHQSPHKTEKDSELPPKPEKPINSIGCELTEEAPLNNGSVTEEAALIPDSLNLIPDSLSKEAGGAINPKKYIFEGERIKLNQTDYERIKNTYPNLNIIQELTQLDVELKESTDKSWYPAMNAKLNYRNKKEAEGNGKGKLRSGENIDFDSTFIDDETAQRVQQRIVERSS